MSSFIAQIQDIAKDPPLKNQKFILTLFPHLKTNRFISHVFMLISTTFESSFHLKGSFI